jgi:preprotein translocase subunit SecG
MRGRPRTAHPTDQAGISALLLGRRGQAGSTSKTQQPARRSNCITNFLILYSVIMALFFVIICLVNAITASRLQRLIDALEEARVE